MQSAQPARSEKSELADKLRWPEATFYISERYRLLYCPIQKVACSSIKLWWSELDETLPANFLPVNAEGKKSIDHPRLNQRYQFKHHIRRLGRHALTDGDWLRFVFVRNPWARLVSAFLNKFVPLEPATTQPVFRAVHRRYRQRTLLRAPSALFAPWRRRSAAEAEPWCDSVRKSLGGSQIWHDAMTFRQFVDFVATSDLDGGEVDRHWRPQYRFLGGHRFQFVGRFERMAEDMRALAALSGAQAPLPAVNRTSYMPATGASETFADCPLHQLRLLSRAPGYRQFYTPQLQGQVAQLYRRDIEQFEYEFDR